jgi:hypothetical protein
MSKAVVVSFTLRSRQWWRKGLIPYQNTRSVLPASASHFTVIAGGCPRPASYTPYQSAAATMAVPAATQTARSFSCWLVLSVINGSLHSWRPGPLRYRPAADAASAGNARAVVSIRHIIVCMGVANLPVEAIIDVTLEPIGRVGSAAVGIAFRGHAGLGIVAGHSPCP